MYHGETRGSSDPDSGCNCSPILAGLLGMAQANDQAGRSSRWAEVLEAPAQIETSSDENALWICQTDLLRCFDYETRSTWRLVCRQA